MTIEQIDQALLALVARQRARMADRLIARLREESDGGEPWYDGADRRLEDTETESARDAAAEEGFRA